MRGGYFAEKESYSAIETDALSEAIQPEFEIKDGVADVSIPEELLVDVDPLWKFLVASKIDIQFIGKKTVLFRVEDAHVRSKIIRRKFWHISEVSLMLNEWTPETAKAPPDLSAMPLWVDLLKLKEGVLVEVNLENPLSKKIYFKGKEGQDVTDCQLEIPVEILKKPHEKEQVVKDFGKDLRLFLNNLSSGTEPEKWVTMGGQSHNSSQGTKLVGKGAIIDWEGFEFAGLKLLKLCQLCYGGRWIFLEVLGDVACSDRFWRPENSKKLLGGFRDTSEVERDKEFFLIIEGNTSF
ncbi:hypothetical protein F2Q69_00030033 [Brassica cretica]|uniref:DUF4283 domain-containing protein n=1 Tax=Brassica cretica TaxID=69181 RepID=A0A8S9S1Y1_BRACR|nr:hypothetical protein F2Q69_00030033 [Brassica cretica]